MKSNYLIFCTLSFFAFFSCSDDSALIQDQSVITNQSVNEEQINLSAFKTANENYLDFIHSQEFATLTSNFNINSSSLVINDFNALESNIGSNGVRYAVIGINNSSNAQLWVYKYTDGTFIALYEDLTNYSRTTGGTSIVYYSDRNVVMDFAFTPVASGMSYRIRNVSIAPAGESYRACVTRVYTAMKAACESDPTCDTMCDFLPSCHSSMLISALIICDK